MKKADIQQLGIDRFDYLLPDEKIAKYPLPERDASKLLLYNNDPISDSISDSLSFDTISFDRFNALPDYLPSGSLLLFNNTRVIHARLIFRKSTGARIEVFCLSPHEPEDYAVNFQQRQGCSWNCMLGNARRWKDEPLSLVIPMGDRKVVLSARKEGMEGDDTIVAFSWDDSDFSFSELLEAAGKLPIPPYLNRHAEASDDETYQTVYSRVEGSVAAPTAGLHFTPRLMERIRAKGIETAEVTLHVGAGTFKPVKSATMGAHDMHTEFISVPRKTIEKLLHHQGKLIVVGTTSMRTVESLYYLGKKLYGSSNHSLNRVSCPDWGSRPLSVDQWEPYDETEPISPDKALEALLLYLERTGEERLNAATRLMIAPGYSFHYPDALITNFHQPRSTLLLLVAAFIGEEWKNVYRFAIEHDFRFLSYGDSSLLWKKPK